MPVLSHSYAHFQPLAGPLYIAGLAGTGTAGYFADQHGSPRLAVLEMAWGLPGNAGRWNGSGGGTWQADIDAYFTARAAQGFTAWWGTPWMNKQIDPGAPYADGRTWDGVYPLTLNGTPGTLATGSETIGLNNTFWARIDYLIAAALARGVAVFLNLGMWYDFQPSGATKIWTNLSSAQAYAFGAALAARYPQASCPNLHWVFGDDTLATNGGNLISQDTAFTQMLAGIQSTGDARNAVAIEQDTETNCHVRFDTGAVYDTGGFGMAAATFNFAYTYQPCYLGVEESYTETGTTLLPVIWGDGPWYGDTDNATPDYTARRFAWWALASGARGINATSGPSSQAEGVLWTWQSGAVAALTSDPNGPWVTGRLSGVAAYFTSLPGWHQLIPDTSSQLVTAGRGSRAPARAPGYATNWGDSDTYVAASRTAAGTLAVLYCGQHFSVTIDQSKMAAGYTATWVDPASCATSAATPGGTYSSTGKGNNSAGDPDWALVLTGP